jgi:hypothetical protein
MRPPDGVWTGHVFDLGLDLRGLQDLPVAVELGDEALRRRRRRGGPVGG